MKSGFLSVLPGMRLLHLAGALAPDAVALGAERVHPEEEGAAAVVEGVEVEDDVVVVVDVVAVGHGGADRGRVPCRGR